MAEMGGGDKGWGRKPMAPGPWNDDLPHEDEGWMFGPSGWYKDKDRDAGEAGIRSVYGPDGPEAVLREIQRLRAIKVWPQRGSALDPIPCPEPPKPWWRRWLTRWHG